MKQEPCFYHGFGSKTAENRLRYKRLLELPKTRKPLIQKGRRLLAGSGEKVTNQKKGRRTPLSRGPTKKSFLGAKQEKAWLFPEKSFPDTAIFTKTDFGRGKKTN